MIDLRSDTLTRPTGAMRRAMASAEVGDDQFGEDPTVRALEARTAALLGKPAAVFVPSGTMANQCALRLHTSPGDQVVIEAGGHILQSEAGAPGLLSGVVLRPVAGRDGVIPPAALAAELPVRRPFLPEDVQAPTTLLCLENTHNASGGRVWPRAELAALAEQARSAGLGVHLDGARIWNAARASGATEAEIAAPADTVSVCYSKGLGAPVGSALAGSNGAMRRARRFRQAFGGALRQSGILAAAALYALEHHRERLDEDHAHARRLAVGLAEIPGIRLDPAAVETNIVRFEVGRGQAADYALACHDSGVHLLPMGDRVLRAVTHLDVGAAEIDAALVGMRRAMAALAGARCSSQ